MGGWVGRGKPGYQEEAVTGQIDTFGEYVEQRLRAWGDEFALHRDFEHLGYARKNMIQVLIEHKGEMPPPNVGYKPLEVDAEAQGIEDIVADIARDQPVIACVLRGYYCGRGRRKVERWETANLLITSAGHKAVTQRNYMEIRRLGFQTVRGALIGLAQAA